MHEQDAMTSGGDHRPWLKAPAHSQERKQSLSRFTAVNGLNKYSSLSLTPNHCDLMWDRSEFFVNTFSIIRKKYNEQIC